MNSPAAPSEGRGRARRSKNQGGGGAQSRSASVTSTAPSAPAGVPGARLRPRVDRVIVPTVDSSRLLLADRYWLEERIGEGSSSTIWRAWDELLARLVAVKVLSTSAAFDHDARAALQYDVRRAIRLPHPGLVTVYDLADAAGPRGEKVTYIVTELLEGETVADRLRQGPLPWREAVRICTAITSALAVAHEDGMTHRDIRSDRIFLTPAGPKLVGLGLNRARALPEPSSFAPAWDGPADLTASAQAQAQPDRRRRSGRQISTSVDAAAGDIHALGSVLIEMLTGSATGNEPVPREVPYEIYELCRQCISPDPSARPAAAELTDLLKSASARARRSGQGHTFRPLLLSAPGIIRPLTRLLRPAPGRPGPFVRLFRSRSSSGKPAAVLALPAATADLTPTGVTGGRSIGDGDFVPAGAFDRPDGSTGGSAGGGPVGGVGSGPFDTTGSGPFDSLSNGPYERTGGRTDGDPLGGGNSGRFDHTDRIAVGAMPAAPGRAEGTGRGDTERPPRTSHPRRNMVIGGTLLALGLVSVFISVDSPPPAEPAPSQVAGPSLTAPGDVPWLTGAPSPSPGLAGDGDGTSFTVAVPGSSSPDAKPTPSSTPATTPTPGRTPQRPPGGGNQPGGGGGGGDHHNDGPPSRELSMRTLWSTRSAVDNGVRAGEIRGDVGLDLNNVIGSLTNDVASGRVTDPRPRARELRDKIWRRFGEQGLTQRQAERLTWTLSPIL